MHSDKDFVKRKKVFFIAVFCGCLIYTSLAIWRHHTTRATVIGSIGAFLMFIYIFLPPVSDALFRLHTAILTKIGEFLTKAFMILFFYVIFCPYGFLLRLTCGDLLKRAIEPDKSSYWIEKKEETDCSQSY